MCRGTCFERPNSGCKWQGTLQWRVVRLLNRSSRETDIFYRDISIKDDVDMALKCSGLRKQVCSVHLIGYTGVTHIHIAVQSFRSGHCFEKSPATEISVRSPTFFGHLPTHFEGALQNRFYCEHASRQIQRLFLQADTVVRCGVPSSSRASSLLVQTRRRRSIYPSWPRGNTLQPSLSQNPAGKLLSYNSTLNLV